MPTSEEFASKVSTEAPWWATAPIWLAAGVVGVPSFIAIAAGYYIAQHVTTSLAQLNQFSQSQLYMLNEQANESKANFTAILRFIDDDLRCQYVTCVNSAKTPQERSECISPTDRERQYGITVKVKK